MTDDQKTNDFKAKWGSRIKPLKAQDGPLEYIEFVLKSDYELILAAIEILSKQYFKQREEFAGSNPPTLANLQAVYIDLERQNPKPINGRTCNKCLGSGYVVNLSHNGQPCNPQVFIKAHASTFAEYVASCSCYFGDKTINPKIRERNVDNSFGPIGGYPNEIKTTKDKVREYIDRCHNMYIGNPEPTPEPVKEPQPVNDSITELVDTFEDNYKPKSGGHYE